MRRPRFLQRAQPEPAPAAGSLAQHYAQRRREPLDENLAVFAAYWNRGYACNPKAIYERALELVPGLRGVWVVKRDGRDAMPAGVEVVHPATPEYFDAIARAGWLVNNVNWPNNLVKRDGQIHVMTHHGTPLKKMGVDMADAPGRTKETDYEAMMKRSARWDYSITANAFSTRAWETAFPDLPYETLETGYPRNDVLARATPETVAAAREAVGLAPEDVAILYAPTHREYETDGSELIDLPAFAAALGPEHVVLARQHYLVGERLGGSGGRVRDVSAHPSTEELCLAADVLVTDYSSIMFDYAVLDRPIVIHAPDWETYRHRRGTYFDLMAEPPGRVVDSAAAVAAAISDGSAGDAEAAALRTAFRERFCSLEDGGAAERVVRAVFGDRVRA